MEQLPQAAATKAVFPTPKRPKRSGWGMSARFTEAPLPSESEQVEAARPESSDGEGWDDFPLPSIYTNDKVELHPQAVDYEEALARYRKTADMTVTGEWMQSFVARASFNLGFMHQFGIGIVQDRDMQAA